MIPHGKQAKNQIQNVGNSSTTMGLISSTIKVIKISGKRSNYRLKTLVCQKILVSILICKQTKEQQ